MTDVEKFTKFFNEMGAIYDVASHEASKAVVCVNHNAGKV